MSARYNREDPRTVLPQLEKEFKESFAEQEKEIDKLEDGLSVIGQVVSVSGSAEMSDVSATADSYVDVGSITLDKGVWIVVCRARFVPSASGDHYTSLCLSTVSQMAAWYDRRYSQSTYNSQHNITVIARPSADNTTYYMVGGTNAAGTWYRQNASSFSIMAVRIA